MADDAPQEVELKPIVQIDGETIKLNLDGKEIEVVDPTARHVIQLFDPLQAQLNEVREQASAVFNLSIPKERKAAGSLRAKIISLRTSAKKIYDAWNKPRLDAAALARDVVAVFEKAVLAIEKPLDDQITAFDAAEAARQAKEKAEREERDAAIKTRIAGIERLPLDHLTSSSVVLEDLLVGLRNVAVQAEVFGDFVAQAETARTKTIASLEGMLTLAKQRETQQAELDRQRKEQEEAEAARRAKIAEEEAALERQREELARAQAEIEKARQEQLERDRAQLEKDRADLTAAGQKQADMLRDQADAFEADRAKAQQDLQARAQELDQREASLTPQEREHRDTVNAGTKANEPAPAPAPAPAIAPAVDERQQELDVDTAIGTANAEATEERMDRVADNVDISAAAPVDAGDAATNFVADEPAAAPAATERGSFGFSAECARSSFGRPVAPPPAPPAPAVAPGDPVDRPDDHTLVVALASLYNRSPAEVLTWLEEMDMFAVRKLVGPQE